MSSSALTLVNQVLLLTGDFSSVPTISGSVGGIAERIVGFINLTISDIEKKANWPELRVNSQGTADGVTGIMDFTGTETVKAGSAVSVWIPSIGALEEVTPEQFDIIVASGKITGLPKIFQRGASSTGMLQVQIHPMPAAGTVINVSAYKNATRLTTTDASTTEFDDELLIYGAMMHMDAYDDMQRGYAALFRDSLNSEIAKLYSNTNYKVMTESYA